MSLSYVVRVNVLRNFQVGFIGIIFFWGRYVLAAYVECVSYTVVKILKASI